MGRSPMTALERFMARRTITETGCWVLAGVALNPGGYVQLWNGSAHRQGHRFSYETFVGAIPEGLELDHVCRNRACVNPAHLEPVTRSVNALRRDGASVTHCTQGHERTRGRKPSGDYYPCRQCHRERMQSDPRYATIVRARKRREHQNARARQIA